MIVRDLVPSELPSVHQLLCANGWAHRVGSLHEFELLIAASQRTAVATSESGEIIGFARGITDGISNGYLSMVVVAAAHRRQGVGQALVRHVMGTNTSISWVLRAGREGADAFFSSLGFSRSTVAMERTRG
ncbi:GNAT family N-acetyltransferase [Ideonella margarita]|uniref:GNAT family N-acetyltransferase n=1 Tax=Ideonella margarita TaxID=2984191 RepID=A0ABU9C6X6_9BURK